MTIRLTTLALLTAFSVPTIGHAGGPIIEDTAEPVAQTHLSPGEKIALVVGALLFIGALAGGGGHDVCQNDTPAPTDGGC